jgi:Iron-dependent Transcriptional regulator
LQTPSLDDLEEAESGRAETTVRLTLHTDFALRVLIQVGLNDGKLTTIKDIAQTFDISKAHLMKVVNDLSQKGYLDTVPGRNGGIRLMREPRNINIGRARCHRLPRTQRLLSDRARLCAPRRFAYQLGHRLGRGDGQPRSATF